MNRVEAAAKQEKKFPSPTCLPAHTCSRKFSPLPYKKFLHHIPKLFEEELRDKKNGNHYYKVIRGFVDGILDENARKRCFEQLMDQFAWGCDAGVSATCWKIVKSRNVSVALHPEILTTASQNNKITTKSLSIAHLIGNFSSFFLTFCMAHHSYGCI